MKKFSYLIIAMLIVAAGVLVYYTWPDEKESTNKTSNSSATTTRTIRVWLGNTKLNPNSADCSLVYPVNRTVAAADPTAALSALVTGPTAAEKSAGYNSLFSAATTGAVQNVRLSNGTAFVNLRDLRTLIPNASASCASTQLLAEMGTTLKQFPEISNTVFALDGNSRDFYEWLQLDCPAESNNCDPTLF